jgi:AraC-like DNA-binding protein
MPVLAFDMTTANYQSRRFEFRGKNKADYYDGELQTPAGRDTDMRIEKSLAGDYSIYKLASRSPLTFRRTWSHIRADKTNVAVFWFVRRGHIAVSTPAGRNLIHPHECAVTRSARPFYMECLPDESGSLEAIHVVVPAHKLYTSLSESLQVGQPFPTSKGDLLLAERIFSLLFEEGEAVDPATAERLVETLIEGLGRSIERISGHVEQRTTIADRRVTDITRYIHQNFANSDLNAKMVAESCGISLRYLCHILKKQELSFSNLVWTTRIQTAHGWLRDARMRHHSICEIAYQAGFKSSAHFTRMFKSRFGVAPREFRNANHDADAVERDAA